MFFFIQTCENKSIPECITLQVLEMLPTITCVSPRKALSLMSRNTADFRDRILMDQKEFRTEIFQRAYQYLKWYDSNSNLDIFSYTKGSVEGSPKNCLQMLLRFVMGVCHLLTMYYYYCINVGTVELNRLHGQRSKTLLRFWITSYSSLKGFSPTIIWMLLRQKYQDIRASLSNSQYQCPEYALSNLKWWTVLHFEIDLPAGFFHFFSEKRGRNCRNR